MANFIVTNLFDAGAGSLRQAIFDANALPDADIIEFASSLSGGTIELTSSELLISSSLTINGLGANVLTIRGVRSQYNPYTYSSYGSRIFHISGSYNTNVQINGLTISGGKPYRIDSPEIYYGNGGGILNSRGNLTITNSIISDNRAVLGGGIFTAFGRTTIIDSLISGNSAESGGGVYNGDIINSTITNNRAIGGSYLQYSGFGGGVAGNAIITNSLISNNSAVNAGGGIGNVYGGYIQLLNSTVSGNSDGGIYSYRSRLEVVNSTISGNSEVGIFLQYGATGTLVNSTISGNNGDGVLITEFSEADITNVTIADNAGIGLRRTDGYCAPYERDSVCVNVTNTIITNSGSGIDCSGLLDVNVNNLIADGSCDPLLSGDPQLGPLQNNGGPTQTHALLPDSIAINAGSNAGIPPQITTDQRGFDRIFGPHVDIGAFEAAPPNPEPPVSVPEPEPLTLLGVATTAMLGNAFKRKLAQRRRKKCVRTEIKTNPSLSERKQ